MTKFAGLAALAGGFWLSWMVAAPARALPIFSFADSWTDHIDANPLTFPSGDFVQIAVTIDPTSTPDPVSSLTVVAYQGTLSVPLNYVPGTAGLFDPLYATFVPFAGAPTGSLTIAATDSTGTNFAVTPPIANPQLLPFVTDVMVSDTSTTPTVSWVLPDLTGFQVDGAQIRGIDSSTEVALFGMDLPAAATTFKVPDGILVPGRSYVYMVLLEDAASDGNGIEAWSHGFSGVTRVPEPGAPALTLAVLAGIGGAVVRARRVRVRTA